MEHEDSIRDLPVDPARFGDPLAVEVPWDPLKFTGASFVTHQLVRTEPSRLEFQASQEFRVFALIFFIVGVVMAGGGAALRFLPGAMMLGGGMLLFGLLFLGMAVYLWCFAVPAVVFDRQKGYCRIGGALPESVTGMPSGNCIPLQDIHALQLLSEYILKSRPHSSFYSYELNLVLRDGRRINIMDHGDLGKFREQAEALSRFLGVPVWDAVVSPQQ